MSVGKRRRGGIVRAKRESCMSQFEDRQKGQEAKFAFDAEKKFKAEARRNKLVGIWAAELEEAGDEDVFRKVAGDLKAKGVSIGDDVIRQKMAQLVHVANEQIASE